VAAVYTIDHSTLLVVGLKAIPASRSFALARTLFEHLPPAEEYYPAPPLPPRIITQLATLREPFLIVVCWAASLCVQNAGASQLRTT